MKKLLYATLLFFGLASATHAAEVTLEREFELESNFCKVVALVMAHPEVIGGEIKQKEPVKEGVVISLDKGPIWYKIDRNLVTVKGEELWFKSHTALNLKSLVIMSNLDSESEFLEDTVSVTEIHKKEDGGTLVKIRLTVDADMSSFFLRRGARVNTFRMEKEIRTLVGESVSEQEE